MEIDVLHVDMMCVFFRDLVLQSLMNFFMDFRKLETAPNEPLLQHRYHRFPHSPIGHTLCSITIPLSSA